MAESEDMRITVTIDKLTYRKISELAERMGASQSKMASMLLEMGIEDNEWVIRMVTSRVVDGIRGVFGAGRPSKRKAKSNSAGNTGS